MSGMKTYFSTLVGFSGLRRLGTVILFAQRGVPMLPRLTNLLESLAVHFGNVLTGVETGITALLRWLNLDYSPAKKPEIHTTEGTSLLHETPPMPKFFGGTGTGRIKQKGDPSLENADVKERMVRATEMLASDDVAVRMEAIRALQDITNHDIDEHWAALEILTTHIRTTSRSVHTQNLEQILAGLDKGEMTPEEAEAVDEQSPELPLDVRVALNVICTRKLEKYEHKGNHLDFSNCLLPRANFRQAHLRHAIFNKSNLEGASFWRALAPDCDFFESNLHNASMAYADLTGSRLLAANLNRALLTDTNLCNSKMPHANFDFARMKGANLKTAVMIGTSMRNATLTGANLVSGMMMESDLSQANLLNAHLVSANLNNAILSGANLCGADLSGAYMRGADLRGAVMWDEFMGPVRNLTREQLNSAMIDEYTILPPGNW